MYDHVKMSWLGRWGPMLVMKADCIENMNTDGLVEKTEMVL